MLQHKCTGRCGTATVAAVLLLLLTAAKNGALAAPPKAGLFSGQLMCNSTAYEFTY